MSGFVAPARHRAANGMPELAPVARLPPVHGALAAQTVIVDIEPLVRKELTASRECRRPDQSRALVARPVGTCTHVTTEPV